ncbi:MAG: peptide chain release factor N(5)-glutamine methyltransferase, partial [Betaproteobacteria bacterium]|nr:peptide chain release factor N(5)-glutamine methyltransferase [Betaproteobacteria bacterium]
MIIAEALNPREPFSIERRRLLEHLTQRNYAYLIAHSNESLSASQEQLFNTYLTRLKGGEPLAYILGEQEFYGLSFKVNPQVLIPRPDTELLVDHALSLIQTLNHPQVIDLGTGSGAIAITLTKHCPALTMTATDISPAALNLAQRNAKLILKDKSSSMIWL